LLSFNNGPQSNGNGCDSVTEFIITLLKKFLELKEYMEKVNEIKKQDMLKMKFD
jgi:hypothetical protein